DLYLVEAGFAGRAGFPAAVNPVPMIGMLADHLLDRVGVALRVLAHGSLAVASLLGVNGGQNFDLVMNRVALAYHERRQHRRTGGDRHPRHAVAGGGGHPEEIDEHALAHIEVERDCEHPVLPQHPHHLASARLALDESVPMADSRGAYGGVNQRIAQRTMNDGEVVAVDGVGYRQELEISVVCGHHQYAAAVGASLRLVPIFL